MPKGLTPAARVIWRRDAPRALAALTLTAITRTAFADYCSDHVLRDQLRARLDAEGWTIRVKRQLKRHPLAGECRFWTRRVELLQGRFRLTGDGREIPPAAPTDPFEQFLRNAPLGLGPGDGPVDGK